MKHGKSKGHHIFISCLVTINDSGMLINFLVIVMFLWFRGRLLSSNDNKFLFSMTIADCLVGLFGITGGILEYLEEYRLVPLHIMKLCGLLQVFGSFFLSILSFSILTTDRVIPVAYAILYNSIMTEFRAKFSNMFNMVYSCIHSSHPRCNLYWSFEESGNKSTNV